MKNNAVYALSIADLDFNDVDCIGAFSTIGGMLDAICHYAEDAGCEICWDHFEDNIAFLIREDDLDNPIVLFWNIVPLN